MTTYTYSNIAVYAELAGALRLARNARSFVTDPTTGLPVNVTQGAVVAPYLDTDAAGVAAFTAESWPVRVTTGAVFEDVYPVEAPQAMRDAVIAAAASQAAAEAAAAAATGPADTTVAGLLGNPASATRVATDGLYEPAGDYVTTTIANKTYAPSRPGLVVWRQARDAMATAPARVLCIGDSITEGDAASGITTRWTSVLASLLAARYAVPTSATGHVTTYFGGSTANPFTKTNAPLQTNPAGKLGVQAGLSALLTASTGTVTGTVTGTAIDVHYATTPATGAFTVKVDGVQVGGTYGGTSPAITDGNKARVALGASAAHAIQIIAGAAGPIYVTGVTVFDGNTTTGLQVFNVGNSGRVSADYSAPAPGVLGWQQAYQAIAPHLVIIMLTANDYAAATVLGTYQTSQDTILANIRSCILAAHPQPSILLVAPPKINYATAAQWDTYIHAMRTAAKKDGTAEFFDLGDLMPDIGSTAGNASGYYADGTHPTTSGHARFADILDELLADDVVD